MIAHAEQRLVVDDFQRCSVPSLWFDSERLTIQQQVFDDLLELRSGNLTDTS
jgi:hypothetical protein